MVDRPTVPLADSGSWSGPRFLILLGVLLLLSRPVAAQELTLLTPEDIQRQFADTQNKAAVADSYKALGDLYASTDEIKQAADAYEAALWLERKRFSRDERVQMAIYISWDGRLKSAIDELTRVLEEEPGNRAARLHRARVYSWNGDLDLALHEADTILAAEPDQKDALLVKANALEWSDRFGEAIPIYKDLSRRDGDFDANLGLASSLLYSGDRAGAVRQARSLVATDPRQERELRRVVNAIDEETKPRVNAAYNFYSDSDHNSYNRYMARYGIAVGNQDIDLQVGHTDSGSGTRSDDFSFGADFNAPGAFGVAVGIGATRLSGPSKAHFPTGNVQLHGRVAATTLNATVNSELLSETDQLIRNHVRRLSATVDASQRFGQRLTIGGAFTRSNFSDANRSNTLQVRTDYSLSMRPRFSVGYQFRFTDFDGQSGSGFFDPQEFAAHRLFASVYIEGRKVYTYFQAYGGHQSFQRYGEETRQWIKGGIGSIGFKLTSKLTFELNTEGGDFAAGTISGYRYFTAGSKVSYRF